MFSKNTQQWIGIIFSIILSTQYLQCAAKAYYHHPYNEGIILNKIALKEYDDTALQTHHRQKRVAVVAVLFALSIFAMAVNIATDIYLQVKGCCGFYPSACEYRDEFLAIRDDLRARADRMNDEHVVAMNLLEYIKQTNLNNMDIWQELNRIMILTERVIKLLDPELLNKLSMKAALITNELARRNRTLLEMNSVQLVTEYNGVFSSAKTAAMAFGPIVGILGVQGILAGIKWYKASQAAKVAKLSPTLSAKVAPNVLGASDVSAKASVAAKTQTKGVQAVSKASKFAKFAGAATSIISIALDVYQIVQKVKGCEKVRDQCKEARDTIKPEVAKFEESERKLIEFKNELDTAYTDVKAQMQNDKFLGYSDTLTKLAQGADVQTPELKKAAQDITTFKNSIKSSEKERMIDLQKSFYNALTSIKYTWTCFDKKAHVVSYVTDHCRTGTNTMQFLFDTVVERHNAQGGSCKTATGRTYVTFQATSSFVASVMEDEKLNIDCILNNDDLIYIVCNSYAEGFENHNIGSDIQLTDQQVANIIKNCKPATVSPRLKQMICEEKVVNSLEKTKQKYSRYNQQEVIDAYNSCPEPSLPQPLKDTICSRKNNGYSESNVIQEFNQYDATVIRNAYRTCTMTLTPDQKNTICLLKTYNQSFNDIKAAFNLFPDSTLQAAYNSCP